MLNAAPAMDAGQAADSPNPSQPPHHDRDFLNFSWFCARLSEQQFVAVKRGLRLPCYGFETLDPFLLGSGGIAQ